MDKLIAICMTLLISVPSHAQSRMKIAEEYLEAYQKQDFKKLSGYYSEEAVFTDPTFMLINPEGFHIEGKDNIIKALTDGFKEIISWKLEIKAKFKSGNYVVVNGMIKSSTKGAALGRPDQAVINLYHPFTTILQFEGTKIARHTDYIDYEKAGQQIYDR